jgi:hypothetical protein
MLFPFLKRNWLRSWSGSFLPFELWLAHARQFDLPSNDAVLVVEAETYNVPQYIL